MILEEQSVGKVAQKLLEDACLLAVEILDVLSHIWLLFARLLEICENELVEEIKRQQRARFDFEAFVVEPRDYHLLNQLDQEILVEPQEHELQVLFEELFD